MLRKWGKRFSVAFFSSMVLFLFTCLFYQCITTFLDFRRYPAAGKLVDIGGYKLHIHSLGSGGPAVVLEIGLGCISSDWEFIQKEIAGFTQVISYDRAGTGWSEESPFARTSDQIVRELHLLLEKANIPKPYILVGHSFGGNNVQLYAATYPDEVLGIVLVDSCHELQETRLPIPPKMQSHIKLMQNSKTMRMMSTLGLSRFLLQKRLKTIMPYSTEALQGRHLALCSTIKHIKAISGEAKYLSESFKQLRKADFSKAKQKPCVILSAGKESNPEKFNASQEQMVEMQKVWSTLQRELASKFDNSHHLVAERSDHMIPWHEPELIIESVKNMIQLNSL